MTATKHSAINTWIGIYVAAMTTLGAVFLGFALNKLDAMNTRGIQTEERVNQHTGEIRDLRQDVNEIEKATRRTTQAASLFKAAQVTPRE